MSRLFWSGRAGLGIVLIAATAVPVAGQARKTLAPPPQVDAPATSNFHLLPVPNDNPFSMIGRFFAEGAALDDEMQAASLSCSRFFRWEVAGGGMHRQEHIALDHGRAAALSIPAVTGGRAAAGDSVQVRVDYQQTAVARAVVDDIDGLRDCCTTHACPDRYISSFVQGTATVSSYRGHSGRGSVRGAPRGAMAAADLHREESWEQAWQVEEPLYFAYTFGSLGPLVDGGVSSPAVAGGSQTIGCGAWVQLQPKDSTDKWRVKGQFEWGGSRREACMGAMADATHQASMRSGISTSGSMVLDGSGDIDVKVSAHTSGTYSHLKATHECVETRVTPEGDRYRCTVMVEVPVPAETTGAEPGSE